MAAGSLLAVASAVSQTLNKQQLEPMQVARVVSIGAFTIVEPPERSAPDWRSDLLSKLAARR